MSSRQQARYLCITAKDPKKLFPKVLEQLDLTVKARSAKRGGTALSAQVSFAQDDPIFESIWDAILKGQDVSAGLLS